MKETLILKTNLSQAITNVIAAFDELAAVNEQEAIKLSGGLKVIDRKVDKFYQKQEIETNYNMGFLSNDELKEQLAKL